MIFEKIGLIDSSFQYQSDMTVVTKGDRYMTEREKYFYRDSTTPTAIRPCV